MVSNCLMGKEGQSNAAQRMNRSLGMAETVQGKLQLTNPKLSDLINFMILIPSFTPVG